jgi:hypothetical protein
VSLWDEDRVAAAISAVERAVTALEAIQARRNQQHDKHAEQSDPVTLDKAAAQPSREDQQTPPRPNPDIDFNAVAEALLRLNQRISSKLVAFMKDRSTATFQEVMDQVHGGERSGEAIRSLVNRTNNLLHDQESRLTFSTKDSQVIRHIAVD